MVLVADTSALVSLAVAKDGLALETLFREYEVYIPSAIVEELEEIATYDDAHADSARRVLDRIADSCVHEVEVPSEYPLDAGESAAIELADRIEADAFLCDEYRELATIHALLSTARLLTTPKLIEAFVRRGVLTSAEASDVLSETIDSRRTSSTRSASGTCFLTHMAR
jgi:predicted nucleic acid-binding protein